MMHEGGPGVKCPDAETLRKAKEEVGMILLTFLEVQGWPEIPRDKIMDLVPAMWKELDRVGLVEKYDLSYRLFVAHAQSSYRQAEELDIFEAVVASFTGRNS